MAFFDQRTFNPQSFGGQGGNLLEFLRTMQTQQQVQPSAGFGGSALPPSAQPTQGQMNLTPDRYVPVGDYQMPQFGSPLPQQAAPQAMNANAQMQPQQRQMPDFGGNIMAGLNNLNSGGNPITMLANVVDGFATGQRHDRTGRAQQQASMTAQALVARGLEPALAQTVASNPELLRVVLPQMFGMGGQTDDIKEYQFAKREDPTLTFDKFMQRKKSVTGEFGLTPIWGTGPDGKPAYIQPGKSGEARLAKLPEGFQIARDPIKIDGPTGTTILDPQSRQIVGFIPKDVAGAASAKAEGAALGEAKAAYDSMTSKMPGLETVVKKLDGLSDKATYTLGGQAVDYATRQAGLEPRAAAIARSEYTSMVDNQILPLLRDTFGAAFTQKEGDTLRATLGDPDKSPKEKQAILKSFIEQKRRDIEALAQRTGRSAPAAAPAASGLPAGWSVKVN